MAAGCGVGSSRHGEQFGNCVLLSARAEDVPKSTIDGLCSALKQIAGITAVYHETGLLEQRGDEIESKKLHEEVMERSKIAIVMLSRTYAASHLCLDELVKIMDRMPHGLRVLPVFYDIDPTHVRHQSGPYQEAFKDHEAMHGGTEKDQVSKWRRALTSAADLPGPQNFQAINRCEEVQFIEHVINEVMVQFIAPQVSLHFRPMKTDASTKMNRFENVQQEDDFETFRERMTWSVGIGCPLEEILFGYNLDKPVTLDIQKSCLVHAWNCSQYMGELKILNPNYLHRLVSTPDLCDTLTRQSMSSEDRINLIETSESIEYLKSSQLLNLKMLVNLVQIGKPSDTIPVYIIRSAEESNFGRCYSLFAASKPAILKSNTDVDESPDPLQPRLPLTTLCKWKTLELANQGENIPERFDLTEMLSCAPLLERLDLSRNPIRVLSNTTMVACSKLRHLTLDYCSNLESVSNISEDCYLSANHCNSLKSVMFYRRSMITGKSTEIEYDVSGGVVIERTIEMNEDRAGWLGFPDLHTLCPGSELPRGVLPGRGIYQAGMYNVYLVGNHLAKWFLDKQLTFRGETVTYWVPSNGRSIRALNVGCLGSRPAYITTIENVNRMWVWTYNPPLILPGVEVALHDEKVTWLSHWFVTKHRQIRPDDLLQIQGVTGCEYIAVDVLYAEERVDGEGAESDEDEFHGKGKSVDSSSICSVNINKPMNTLSEKMTWEEEKKQFDSRQGKEEDVDSANIIRTEKNVIKQCDRQQGKKKDNRDSANHVGVWYENNFRSHDLSFYEKVKQKTDEEDCYGATASEVQQSLGSHLPNNKPRKYYINSR